MPPPPCPVLPDDESDSSSCLPVIFSNNASDTDFSATPSDPESSSESEVESEESQDELGLDDEDEQLSPEYFLREAESLDVSQLRQKRYSPKTQERLDETQNLWKEFCKGAKRDPIECLSQLCDTENTVRFLKAFFSWRCRRRQGKNGRRNPGLKHKSSLESLWKWWHLIYKSEVGYVLSKDIQVKIRDVLAIVAKEEKLSLQPRPKATMYIEDVAEFA